MNVINDQIYAVSNIGNQNQIIFHQYGDYLAFANLFNLYLEPFCTLYCFTILPNQFHFLVHINSAGAQKIKIGALVLTRFSNGLRLLQCRYAIFRNKKYTLAGSSFKQKANVRFIDKNNLQLLHNCLESIHHSPMDCHMVTDVYEWRYSSIHQYFDTGITEDFIKVKSQKSVLYNMPQYRVVEF